MNLQAATRGAAGNLAHDPTRPPVSCQPVLTGVHFLEDLAMARDPTPTFGFSLAVVRRGRRALLVHERKHGQEWYLPAGRKEPLETFTDAALRETQEEAGIDIVLEGVLGIEHRPLPGGSRVRVIFLAREAGDTPPKSIADEHSLKAGFFTLEEMFALPLRGDDVLYWVKRALEGGVVAPLSLLDEGSAEQALLKRSSSS
jgi:ADP-ribose pyrophosphatase YjhB (NUDIX family)